jgi:hypothetical protein
MAVNRPRFAEGLLGRLQAKDPRLPLLSVDYFHRDLPARFDATRMQYKRLEDGYVSAQVTFRGSSVLEPPLCSVPRPPQIFFYWWRSVFNIAVRVRVSVFDESLFTPDSILFYHSAYYTPELRRL